MLAARRLHSGRKRQAACGSCTLLPVAIVLVCAWSRLGAGRGGAFAPLGRGGRAPPRASPAASAARAAAPAVELAAEAAAAPAEVEGRPRAAGELLALLDADAANTGRGAGLSPADRRRVFELADELEALGGGAVASGSQGTAAAPLSGMWRLLFQGSPGAEVSATSLESWQKYFAGDGPSPLQNLVTTDTASVGSVYQLLELGEGEAKAPLTGSFLNLIDFSPTGCLEINADLEGEVAPRRLAFRFRGGEFRLRPLWNGTLTLPYPVPFALLGDNAVGWLETLYLDEGLRVSRGNKGSLFVLKRDESAAAAEGSLLRADEESEGDGEKARGNEGLTKDPVVVCPAQFGTPGDYERFVAELRSRGHPVFVAPLGKLNWFELVPSFLSKDYWTGELKPSKVLQFYYRALEEAITDARSYLSRRGTGGKIHIVAHSIGGWIARSFMGEVLAPKGELGDIASLVTLGTPHVEPPKGSLMEVADQTRGLLKYINAEFPGAFHAADGVRYISVGAEAVPGRLPFGMAGEDGEGGPLERLLAWTSYFALCGDGAARGDGITPLACALLPGDGVQHVKLSGEADCFHADFLPSPGPSIPLRGAPWYGTGAALDKWLPLIQ